MKEKEKLIDSFAKGIDFWWLDWQQEETTAIANVNPTFWLNYCFFTNPDMWYGGRAVSGDV